MRNVEILINDGFIGNKAVLLALSALTTGNLNSKLKQNVQPYTIKEVLPSTHDYIIVPLSEEEAKTQANEQLLAFLVQSPGGLKHLGLENV